MDIDLKKITVVYVAKTEEDMRAFYKENVLPFVFEEHAPVSAEYVCAGNTTIKED